MVHGRWFIEKRLGLEIRSEVVGKDKNNALRTTHLVLIANPNSKILNLKP
jgi:hypothetical protein